LEIIIKKSNLPANQLVEISKSPKIIAFFDGKNYFILSGICRHAKWPLELGKVNNHTLTCAGHGWEYDITNGKCLSNPGRDLDTYKIIEKEEEIVVKQNNS